jgi:hypothetical protein
MTELQQILSDIVDDLEETVAGLSVLAAHVQLPGGINLGGALDERTEAKQTQAAFYNRIRKKIAALAAAPVKSDRKA